MTLTATRLMPAAWEKGLTDKANPFDEALEHKWVKQWPFYANSVRFGSAVGGPDFAGFEDGWRDLNRNLQELQESIEINPQLKKDHRHR